MHIYLHIDKDINYKKKKNKRMYQKARPITKHTNITQKCSILS